MRSINLKEERLPVILSIVRQLAEGRSFAAGSVTLTANQATTTVSNVIIPAGCYPQLTPASSSAAAEWGNGTIYVSSVANGSFVITHANSADATRVVHWNAVGG